MAEQPNTPRLDAARSFPRPGGAASAGDVSLALEPAPLGATLECRSLHADRADVPFASCAVEGGRVRPLQGLTPGAQSEGAWLTELRYRLPDGRHGGTARRRFYVHASLDDAELCHEDLTDAAWFAAADKLLARAGRFPEADTTLENPRIRVTYEPPLAGRAVVSAAPVRVELRSLRRRFVLDETRERLLIVRAYASRHTGSCRAYTLETRADQGYRATGERTIHACDAVVLNRAGAGVCLVRTREGIVPERHESWLERALGDDAVVPLMWRLTAAAGEYSQKCDEPDCDGLYLR